MSFGDHTALIRQVQLSLREEAGLSSYDPHDPNLPPIPPLRESIAALDPSPPDLRCKHCQGRLLRGLQSVICVYCGRRQQRDVKPDPIAFKSTLGYQWLLQSLGLDGSETVGPALEENEHGRGQSTTGGETVLSDLLNLQIAWSTELEKNEVGISDNVAVQRSKLFDLPEDDELDNFFAESRRDIVPNSSEEKPRPENQSANIDTKVFPSQEKNALFPNVQQSVAVSSSAVDGNEGFSAWEADFQSSDSGNQQETSTSFPSFAGSNVDLSFHMDSVFGPVKDLQSEKAKDASTPLESATGSWMQDDLWNDSNLLAPHQDKQIDATIQSKDDEGGDKLYTTTTATTSVDWFTDDQFQTSSPTAPLSKSIKENDDSFDVWTDCVTAPEIKATEENDESFDVWTDCAAAPENKAIDENDDSFDDWNDFTSSTKAEDPFKNSLEQSSNHVGGADVQIQGNMFASSIENFEDVDFGSFAQAGLAATSVPQNGSVEKFEDIDFGSFSQAGVAATSSTQNGPVENFEDIDFSSFSQAGLAEASSTQKGSVEANSLPKEDLPWMANVKDEAAKTDDHFNPKASPEQHDIESLLSQMHDLSFMLKGDLSVPSKPDDPSLF